MCRRKKLRCSRQQPCSNCVARGVKCEREVGLPLRATTLAPGPTEEATRGDGDVIARLQRVEDLLSRVDAKITAIHVDSHDSSPASRSAHTITGTYPSYAASGHQSRLTSAIPSPDSHGQQSLEQVFHRPTDAEAAHRADSHRLDSIGGRQSALTKALANQLQFMICPISETLSIHSSPSAPYTGNPVVILPTRVEALNMVAVYEENIEFLHHITYGPKTLAALNEVYDSLECNLTPRTGAVALIASICASAAAFQFSVGTKKDLLGIDPSHAETVCHKWAKATYDCLDASERMGLYGLEDLQAMITIFFLMYNLEGFSSRTLSGVSLCIGIARALGLHRVDHLAMTQHGLAEPEDQVELEIKRRIWWHTAATDWQAGVTGGPQEGTYSIQPRHTATSLPRNIEDEDLQTQGPTFERPLSVPTASSYLVQRIRLAEICRKIIDAMPLGLWGGNPIRYEDVVALDLEFEKFARELPPFFEDSPQARHRYRELYERRPAILVQKYTINIIFQNRRCRLHQPFLVRGFADPAYARSRDVCLQAARAVMAISVQLNEEKAIAASILSMSGVHHHMFFAAVALVMDLCFNKTDDDAEQEAARRAEVMDACRRLEKAKRRSPVAKRFLDSLMDVMRKHKIRLFDGAVAEEAVASDYFAPEALPSIVPEFEPMDTSQSDFEEIWQAYIENGPNLDVPDWTELYDDLQSQLK